MKPSDGTTPPLHDVVVLSDLHLGRGRNEETGRFHALETFFYDEDINQFCRYLCAEAQERETGLIVVFNGDTFDLLRIEPESVGPGARRREKRYGPSVTPEVAASMMKAILAGHPQFVEGLATLLDSGHRVVFLPGNHDIELQWPPVQAEIRSAIQSSLRARRGDPAAEEALQQLCFEEWFHHEPGRLWIEHGCQYDAESSFRYFLRTRVDEQSAAAQQLERDLPLGSFFQRYLYNAFGALTFIVPSSRANLRYFRWLVTNRPAVLFRVLTSHGPFGLQLLRRLAKTPERPRALEEAHQQSLEELALRSGLGDRLKRIDEAKDVPPDLAQAVRAVAMPLAKLGVVGSAVALSAAGLWFACFNLINQLQWGFGLKTLAFLALNLVMVVAFLAGLTYVMVRQPPGVHPRPLRRAAQRIVEILDVSVVTFGHTHDEVLWRLDRPSGGKSTYFNTGTWIAVFTHDALVPRERVQFTFLRVRGHQGELVQWSPGRGRAIPVILMDE